MNPNDFDTLVTLLMFVCSSQVLEVPSGKLLATLPGHTKTVLHCKFSQNGQTLITSSEDTTIRVGSPSVLHLLVLVFSVAPIHHHLSTPPPSFLA